MDRIPIWVLLFITLLATARCEEDEVKESLIEFFNQLSAGNVPTDEKWGWKMDSDPCTDNWVGIECDDTNSNSVKKIVLENLNFAGVLDTNSLCKAKTLAVFSIKGNNVAGKLTDGVKECKQLTHLFLAGNNLSGNVPDSLSRLSRLKRLDISDNGFSGELPEIGRISGLLSFFAENNDLSGTLPEFDFSNLDDFNVSNNNFTGPVPDVHGKFRAESFAGNPGLCGELLSRTCPPSKNKPGIPRKEQVLIYSGFIIFGLLVVLFIAYKLAIKNKGKVKGKGKGKSKEKDKSSIESKDYKVGGRSEYSITSVQSSGPSPLVVLNGNEGLEGLRFEDLLRAPAEILGRGKHGSLYKVVVGGGVRLAVKRIKDWGISREEFKKRMKRIDQVKHPNVLSAVAFYCSNQEKLLAYEYHPNGSLFNLLHGSQNGKALEWRSRLGVAAIISKALAFMHKELTQDAIPHGNLKSSNILFNTNLEPCISEYGLMVFENDQNQPFPKPQNQPYSTFKIDVYGLGVILLELLTGKVVQNNNGAELAKWVRSVICEEWTVEVFDSALAREGASEESMVSLLQVALKCLNASPNERPSMRQVAGMIDGVREVEERSIASDML